MKVINKDKDGNIIPDLSKKVIPKNVSDLLVRMLYEKQKAKTGS